MLRFDSMLSGLILKVVAVFLSLCICSRPEDVLWQMLHEACPQSIKWDNKGPTQSWSMIRPSGHGLSLSRVIAFWCQG